MSKLDLCDFSHAYILVKGTITATSTKARAPNANNEEKVNI